MDRGNPLLSFWAEGFVVGALLDCEGKLCSNEKLEMRN